MTYTPIAHGAPDWDVPLNAALSDQDIRITQNSVDITGRVEKSTLVYNVKDFGAAGSGTGDDTAEVQAAIDAAAVTNGGIVYFPPGVYPCSTLTLPNNVFLEGAGRRATQIRKASTGILINMSGPATDPSGATHCRYGGITNMTLNGNSLSGAVLQVYYSDNHYFQNVFFTSNVDSPLVDAVEFWDSRFYNCQFESVTGAADSITPAVWIRNSAATSGFGFSADTSNQLVFDACRWENFANGAVRIQQGTNNTNTPNGFYFTNCKMETSNMRGGSHLFVQDACKHVVVNGLYCFAGNFFAGYSTPQNVISWSPQASSLSNVLIANQAVATISSGVLLFSGAGSNADLSSVVGSYVTSPTGAHIFFSASSTADFTMRDVWSNLGSQFGGTLPTKWASNPVVAQFAGVPADASFSHGQLNGSLALNTSTNDLYVRHGGVWRAQRLSGTAVLAAGTVTVANTAVTANSRIFLTSQVNGGTPGFLRIGARNAGVDFTITSSSGTDTSTVAWMIIEP